MVGGYNWRLVEGRLDEVAEGKRFDTDFGQLAMAQFASVPRRARFVCAFQ